MKANHTLRRLLGCVALLGLAGCDLSLEPYEGQSAEVALGSVEGIRAATMGNYSIMAQGRGNSFAKMFNQMSEFPSDNVSLSGTTSSPLFYVYNYAHFQNMGYINNLWRYSYEMIYGTNQVIENIQGDTPELNQLRGENLFLRAFAHYSLAQAFGRPFVQGRENLAVPIIKSTAEAKELGGRNTVGEVYDFVVADLQKAAELMTVPQPSTRASREVAYALLSRVYLNMGDNAKAIEYADRVINSGRYRLADTNTFKRANEIVPEGNPETIFAIRHTASDDAGWGAIGSLYYKSPGGVGWGEMYASESYRALLNQNPEDARHAFIFANYAKDKNGQIVRDAKGEPVLLKRNGYPQYFITKYSNQEGNVTLSSPVILRLAEVYLNRAEAYAKLGQPAQALEDVNLIRRRAGLSGAALYSAGDLKGHDSVLDVVLEERQLELAFEGHRKYDLLRNNRPLVRAYPGTHLNPGNPGVNMAAGTQVIQPDHPRVVYFIPENEVELNPKLLQNP